MFAEKVQPEIFLRLSLCRILFALLKKQAALS